MYAYSLQFLQKYLSLARVQNAQARFGLVEG